jgi:hypothetical protein
MLHLAKKSVSSPRKRGPSVRSGEKMISAPRKTLLRFTNWVLPRLNRGIIAGMTRYGVWERKKSYFSAAMSAA